MRTLTGNFNCLESLPDELMNCVALTQLRCNRNRIQEVPAGIGKLKALFYLELADNRIQALPESINQLKPRIMNFKRNPVAKLLGTSA